MTDPLLFIGWDLGIRRDTCGLSAIYRDQVRQKYVLWGHRCYEPPVNVPAVSLYLEDLMRKNMVGGVYYDPWQLMSEAQRLEEAGFGEILYEVNQQQESVAFSNMLSHILDKGDLEMYPDATIRSHFSWCGAETSERGYRIVKRRQSKPVDMVVSIAMAVYGASKDHSHMHHSGESVSETHQATSLP